MVAVPHTDFIAAPSGLYVPPEFAKAQSVQTVEERRRLDKRFFAQNNQRVGKFFSSFGVYGAQTTGGGSDKPRDTVSFQALRTLFDASPIDKMIVGARQFQMSYVTRRVLVPERETGWKVMHSRATDPNFENTPDIERRCREVERIIENVNTKVVQGGLTSFFTMMVEDELVYDRKVMIIARDHEGLPHGYWTTDPCTVKPRLECLAPWMLKNHIQDPRIAAEKWSYQMYSQGIRDTDGNPIDLTTAAYVQEIEGQITAAWKEHEIDVHITRPVNRIDHYFYGKSVFEASLEWTEGFNSAFKYNVGWFNSRVPEHLVFLAGEVDPDGFESFQKQILGQGGPASFHRVAFVSGDDQFKMQAMPLRASMTEMAFPQWLRVLIAGKAACYRMDPRIINFDMATGGKDTTVFASASNREQQLTLSEEQGFHTIILHLEDWFNRVLVHPRYDDLVVRWVGLDRPSEAARIEMMQAKSTWMTLNEIRNESGALPPYVEPGYPELGNRILNPALLAERQYIDQSKLLRQQMSQESQAQGYYNSGGSGAAPRSPDTSDAPSSAQGAPEGKGTNPGAVAKQAAGRANGLGKSRGYTITIEDV